MNRTATSLVHRHLVAAALAFSALVPVSASAAMVGFELGMEFGTDQSGGSGLNGYYLFPYLTTEPPPLTTQTFLASPHNDGSFLEPGQTRGNSFAQSPAANFASFKTSVDSPDWTFTTDSNTASPTNYLFDVLASTLADWTAVHATVAAGTQGASYPSGSSPTFAWTGPSGFDYTNIILFGPNSFSGEYMQLGPNATSYATMASLLPGQYTFIIRYARDLTDSSVTATTPASEENGALYPNWRGITNTTVAVQDRITFTVAPEPGTATLLAFAAVGLFSSRKKRAL